MMKSNPLFYSIFEAPNKLILQGSESGERSIMASTDLLTAVSVTHFYLYALVIELVKTISCFRTSDLSFNAAVCTGIHCGHRHCWRIRRLDGE